MVRLIRMILVASLVFAGAGRASGGSEEMSWETCEAYPFLHAVQTGILPLMFVSFVASRDGNADMPTLAERQAGEVTMAEAEKLDENMKLEETPNRRVALDKLSEDLKRDGWTYVETGSQWYARRFRRPLQARH